MSFVLPTFNLTVNIYTGPWLTKSFRGTSPANLAFARRVQQQAQDFLGSAVVPGVSQPTLLLPAGTDIRSPLLAGQNDVVEVPAGSSRWYYVFAVDDIGKGFSNEHRAAVLLQISHFQDPTNYAGCTWPVPMP